MKKAYLDNLGRLRNLKYANEPETEKLDSRIVYACPLLSSPAVCIACHDRCAHFDTEGAHDAIENWGIVKFNGYVTCYGKQIAELVDEPKDADAKAGNE